MVRLEAYQDVEDVGTGGGMDSFDKKPNTMTFSPTFFCKGVLWHKF